MDINDFRITLTFTIDEMNMIFDFLERLPYREVNGLVEELKRQIDPQLLPPENMTNSNDLNNTETDHPL
jgi:methyl coenzyme M reductase gamma subunit